MRKIRDIDRREEKSRLQILFGNKRAEGRHSAFRGMSLFSGVHRRRIARGIVYDLYCRAWGFQSSVMWLVVINSFQFSLLQLIT